MEQKLEYINQGPGGYVVYTNGQTELKFSFEYGGGNCVAIIFVPTIAEWTIKTNLPLTERLPILTFVAEQAIKDKAPSSHHELSENCIQIVTKEV